MPTRKSRTYDVFISHASEDGKSVARPLARLLARAGLRVWIDNQELILGDSLRRKIDQGLAASKWGVVILSQPFLSKAWPQAELDALVSRELSGDHVLLPVWHGLSAKQLSQSSPLLASRLGISTDRGLPAVSKAILAAVRSQRAEAQTKSRTVASQSCTFSSIWFGMSQEVISKTRWTDHPLLGTAADRYVIKEYLGHGGSGVVFVARHRTFGREVALKVLYPIGSHLRPFVHATERAVRGLGSLRDARLASLIDFGVLRYKKRLAVFLAYDLVRGRHVDAWALAIRGRRDYWPRVLNVAIEIAKALAVAHKCVFVGSMGIRDVGVFHGDLKPSNILVSDNDCPVVLDFMFPDFQRVWHRSRLSRSGADSDLETQSFGTEDYMPPEQKVEGIIVPSSDVFSLGLTFIQSFWAAQTSRESDERWHRALNHNKRHLQQRLAAVVNKMIQRRMSDRYKSMAGVARALEKLSH